MFIRLNQERFIIILVYVDDIIVKKSSDGYIQELVEKLNSKFALKEFGPVHFFL